MGGPVLNVAFVFPYTEIAAGFIDVGEKIKDLREPMDQAATDFENDMTDQFRKQGRQRGGWAKLSPITQGIRSQEGFPPTGPILQRTRRFMKSFTQRGAEGHIREIRKMGFTAGSEIKVSWAGKTWNLGHVHDEGWEQTITPRQAAFFQATWGISLWGMMRRGQSLKMPPREIIFVSGAAIRRMMSRVHQYIINQVGQEFRGLVHVTGRM